MSESYQKKLDRVRPPKVQIKYTVKTGDAIEEKELPFVVGTLADLSGDNEVTDANGKKLKIKDQKFDVVDRDNFNSYLKTTKPRLSYTVADKISNEEGKNIKVDINFENIDDFHPEKVADKVEPIRKLVEARCLLASLKQQMDGNDDLEERLNQILKNADVRENVKNSLDSTGDN